MRPADEIDQEKRLAAEAAALLVDDHMRVGLGTGSTVGHLLPALAARRLDVVCVATSPTTAAVARGLGLNVEPFDHLERLDIAIDGADKVAPDFWLIKGGGGAHTREKIVAWAAERFVVIVSSDKLVDRLTGPVPLELLGFGLEATRRAIGPSGVCKLRSAPRTPDGGVLADYTGEIGDPHALACRLATTAGVVEHGLFPPRLVSEIVVARHGQVEHLHQTNTRA